MNLDSLISSLSSNGQVSGVYKCFQQCQKVIAHNKSNSVYWRLVCDCSRIYRSVCLLQPWNHLKLTNLFILCCGASDICLLQVMARRIYEFSHYMLPTTERTNATLRTSRASVHRCRSLTYRHSVSSRHRRACARHRRVHTTKQT